LCFKKPALTWLDLLGQLVALLPIQKAKTFLLLGSQTSYFKNPVDSVVFRLIKQKIGVILKQFKLVLAV
jgi:hypothetical protein